MYDVYRGSALTKMTLLYIGALGTLLRCCEAPQGIGLGRLLTSLLAQGTRSANATAELAAIIQKTEQDMLAIQPCDDADPYFAAAILPHREVPLLLGP